MARSASTFEAPRSAARDSLQAAPSARLRHAWRRFAFPIALFFCTRAALITASFVGLKLVPQLYLDSGPNALTRLPALVGLCRWDCWWFYKLAHDGYSDWIETNFWPLYPLLVGATRRIGIPVEFGLLVWANLAALAAYVVIYQIFEETEGRSAAQWGVALFATGPFAYFHAAGYPESLTILFTALTMRYAIRRKPVAAGTALGFGILTRHVAIFCGPALLVAYVRHKGMRLRSLLQWDGLGLVLPLVFGSLYLAYCRHRFGNALAPFEARTAGWGGGSWFGVWQMLAVPEVAPLDEMYLLSCVLPTIGAVALLTRGKWLELGAYACTLMAVILLIGAWGLGRYAASCWPSFLPLGVYLARHRRLAVAMVAASALLQGLLFFLWSHQFKIL